MGREKKKSVGRPRVADRERTAFGDALRRAREEAGESLVTFAGRLGVAPRTLHGWESEGRKPHALVQADVLRRAREAGQAARAGA